MGTRAVIEFHHDKQQKQPDVRVWLRFDATPDNIIPTLENIYAFLEEHPLATKGDDGYSENVASLYICEQPDADGHLNAQVVSASTGEIPYLSYRYVVRLSTGLWFIEIHDVEAGELIETATIGREDSRQARIQKELEPVFYIQGIRNRAEDWN